MMNSKLFVKHLPVELTKAERNEFFSLFGGTLITNFEGKLKHCCLVNFTDPTAAKRALEALHQCQVLGKRLIVEYAKEFHEVEANKINASAVLKRTVFNSQEIETLKSKNEKKTELDDENELSGICPNLGLFHDFPDHLQYKYPEPNVTILTNIANAMACVPKFYIQVLHLMNKLNLPPPFSILTPSPPLKGDSVQMTDACVDTNDLENFSDESEIDSDSELSRKHKLYQATQQDQHLPPKQKRLKVMAQRDQQKLNLQKSNIRDHNEITVDSAFDLSSSSRRFEFKLGESIKDAVEGKNKSVSYNVFDERGSFGKIQPTNPEIKDNLANESEDKNIEVDSSDEDLSDDTESSEFIRLGELKQNCLTSQEILAMPQFKNYNCGDKTNRLYVKNLAKQVCEKDLQFIFGRFAKTFIDTDKFDIRLMQEGRMKGQAFITFPSEKYAKQALKNIHGYLFHGKPIIVQYAKAKSS